MGIIEIKMYVMLQWILITDTFFMYNVIKIRPFTIHLELQKCAKTNIFSFQNATLKPWNNMFLNPSHKVATTIFTQNILHNYFNLITRSYKQFFNRCISENLTKPKLKYITFLIVKLSNYGFLNIYLQLHPIIAICQAFCNLFHH